MSLEFLISRVIELVENGCSTKEACKLVGLEEKRFHGTIKGIPSQRTNYERAKQSYADRLAEEVIEIADDESLSFQIARNRMDARKWYAAAIKPQTYGNKIDLTVTQIVDIKSVMDKARDRVLTDIVHNDYRTLDSELVDEVDQSMKQLNSDDVEKDAVNSIDDLF